MFMANSVFQESMPQLQPFVLLQKMLSLYKQNNIMNPMCPITQSYQFKANGDSPLPTPPISPFP